MLEQVFTYGTFYVVLAVFLLSFRKGERQDAALSRPATQQLRGFAITAVLLGHMTNLFGLIKMPVTRYLGAQGVEIFLFLSGFGLVSSYRRKGMQGFIKNRLATILIPFWLVNLIKIPLILWLSGTGFSDPSVTKDSILNFLGLSITMDTSMWYVQYILLCYLLFFIIFSFKEPALKTKIYALCLFFLIGVFVSAVIDRSNPYPRPPLLECYSHILSFPLGALFCLFHEKLYALPRKCLAFLSLGGLSLYLLYAYGVSEFLPYYMTNLSFLLFAIPLFLLLESSGRRSKLLSRLGGLAYDIYLNEYVIMICVSILPIAGCWKILLIPAAAVLIAIPTNWIGKRLLKLTVKRGTSET